jgi:O-antigen ligase
MIPLAALVRGRRRDVVFAIAAVVIGAGSIAAALALSPTIYERFFGYDANMNVGGVAINSSGRMEMWDMLWTSAVRTPILGQGPGSSSLIIDYYFTTPGVAHPHNDYLRLFHDLGLVGLGLWVVFQFGAGVRLFKHARADARGKLPHHGCHLVPLLGLIGLAVSMATDNAFGYAFVMYPLAVMIGCSLGLTSGVARPAVTVATRDYRTSPEVLRDETAQPAGRPALSAPR